MGKDCSNADLSRLGFAETCLLRPIQQLARTTLFQMSSCTVKHVAIMHSALRKLLSIHCWLHHERCLMTYACVRECHHSGKHASCMQSGLSITHATFLWISRTRGIDR